MDVACSIVVVEMEGVKSIEAQEPDGCDHTSTNAPDLIRTPQLSVLSQE